MARQGPSGGRIGIALCAGLTLLFGWKAWASLDGHLMLARRGERAEALVVGFVEYGGARSSTTRYPIFRFDLPDGRAMEAVSGATSGRGEIQRGMRVDVLYDPEDPAQVRQLSAVEAGPGMAFNLPGLLALAMGALTGVLLVASRRRGNDADA